jgi:hypothetical protein
MAQNNQDDRQAGDTNQTPDEQGVNPEERNEDADLLEDMYGS